MCICRLIEQCVSGDPSQTPSFASVIAILEEASMTLGRPACPVCWLPYAICNPACFPMPMVSAQ